jgi:hypothetical protein
MKLTPPLNTTGRYVLRTPWAANPGVLYTCAAIRSFDDIYKLGLDVYKTYYEPMGVTEGAIISGNAFNFQQEKLLKPNIITLLGVDNTVIYVPDTFIAKYPDLSEVKYSHMILSVSLGALPDYLDLTDLKNNISDLVTSLTGVSSTVREHRAPSTSNPTSAQHEALEASRTALITATQTKTALLLKSQADLTLANQKIQSLTAIIASMTA